MALRFSLVCRSRLARELTIAAADHVVTATKQIADLCAQFAIRCPAFKNVLGAKDHFGDLSMGCASGFAVEGLQGSHVEHQLPIRPLLRTGPRCLRRVEKGNKGGDSPPGGSHVCSRG